MGRDIPHFKQFIRKKLKKETRENTSPATVETKAGMGSLDPSNANRMPSRRRRDWGSSRMELS